MKSVVLVLAGIFLLAAGEGRKSYEGYQVLSAVPTNKASIEFLRQLQSTDDEVDFWTEPNRLGMEVRIMVGPTHLPEIKQMLTNANISYGVHINNVEDQVGPEAERLANRNASGFNISDFNDLDEINDWLTSLISQCPNSVNKLDCQLNTIGHSYEKNPINIFKISKAGEHAVKSAYWLDATLEAREWIGTATLLQVINHFLTQSDANTVSLIDSYDWYFIPVENPDGYRYTWTKDRMWRKNRRPNGNFSCVGTDLNRNFDINWGNEVSHKFCSNTYCGESGGSEMETNATSTELNRIASTVNAVFDMHGAGYAVTFPLGNTIDFAGETCQRVDDHDDLMAVANATANAIENTWGTDQWESGNSCEVIYSSTGTIDDYAKAVAGIKYTYRTGLRGSSYIVCADEIPLSFEEFYNGLVKAVKNINAP